MANPFKYGNGVIGPLPKLVAEASRWSSSSSASRSTTSLWACICAVTSRAAANAPSTFSLVSR
jgi:hypothetical protein